MILVGQDVADEEDLIFVVCTLAQARDLSGAPSNGDESAASEAVVAVATRAAGDDAKSDSMLAEARRFDQDRPTYYGAAWVALGYALVDAHSPLGCPSP